jgi:hypothetical protein
LLTENLAAIMNAEFDLEEAILDTELRYINFFNGRLLTGGDLSSEQAANRACSRHLGRALGAGVAHGLEVSMTPGSQPTDALVDVAPGLAVNRDGQTLRLGSKLTVALVRPADQITIAGCVFVDCESLGVGTSISGDGFYLLTIAPASARDGLAPVSGLGNVVATCNSQYFVDGVQFRLLPLNVDAGTNSNQTRNVVAYQCFGLPTKGPNDFVTSALSAGPSIDYGLETLVPSGRLTTQDLPLALIEWTGNSGIGFIDIWSVRRRIARRDPSQLWRYFTGDRRVAEAEAIFLQFQDQVQALLASNTDATSILANDRFAFLPPIGFLPIATGGSTGGFAYRTFFQNKVHREPVFIEGAQVVSLIQEALNYPPIDLSGSEMVWLYQVRENMQINPAQAYMIFVNGQVRYRGAARFDSNRWNYANFA